MAALLAVFSLVLFGCASEHEELQFFAVEPEWKRGGSCGGDVMSYRTPAEVGREVCLGEAPALRIGHSDVERAAIRETPIWGEEGVLYVLDLIPTERLTEEIAELRRFHDWTLGVVVGGDLVAVEVTDSGWMRGPKAGAFRTKEAALDVAARIGVVPTVVALSQSARMEHRRRFESHMREYFRPSVCARGSDVARRLEPEWKEFRVNHPEIANAVECD